MDGILEKPVSLAALLDVLDRHVWTAPAAVAQADSSPDDDDDFADSRLSSILAIERINELRTNLPPEIFGTWSKSAWWIWIIGFPRYAGRWWRVPRVPSRRTPMPWWAWRRDMAWPPWSCAFGRSWPRLGMAT